MFDAYTMARKYAKGTISAAEYAAALATALRDAAAAHHEYETRTGTRDANWPEWYANRIVFAGDVDAAHDDANAMRVADADDDVMRWRGFGYW